MALLFSFEQTWNGIYGCFFLPLQGFFSEETKCHVLDLEEVDLHQVYGCQYLSRCCAIVLRVPGWDCKSQRDMLPVPSGVASFDFLRQEMLRPTGLQLYNSKWCSSTKQRWASVIKLLVCECMKQNLTVYYWKCAYVELHSIQMFINTKTRAMCKMHWFRGVLPKSTVSKLWSQFL